MSQNDDGRGQAAESGFTLSVVMPVYNEIRTIEEILRRVLAVDIEKEIVVVDDGSTDGTREYLRKLDDPRIRVFFQETNQGKGAAVRKGIAEAAGDVIVIQDADLEYDPEEYCRLLEPIVDGRADVVFGSRFRGSTVRVHMFWHSVANTLLTLLSNMFTNLNLTDMEVCYKMFRSQVIKNIKLRSNGFGFEPEVTAKVARMKCRIYETPISYSGRDYSEGKKIGWKDAVTAVAAIIYFRFFD
ncbi:MAG: glycosyltransferase family 2 protein [Candidatus Glassbacteria bacterium]|nr:glycosyltransferase family 2 protein [Candidatus Glassbacteria bacterium]